MQLVVGLKKTPGIRIGCEGTCRRFDVWEKMPVHVSAKTDLENVCIDSTQAIPLHKGHWQHGRTAGRQGVKPMPCLTGSDSARQAALIPPKANRKEQRSCDWHLHRNVGHHPGISGHVGPEYSHTRLEPVRSRKPP